MVTAHPPGMPASPFAGDTGGTDPALVHALSGTDNSGAVRPGSAHGERPDRVGVQRALVAARVLTVVVAGGIPGAEHGAEISSVTITGRDGRSALPVFSSLATMQAWDPSARPVPMAAPDAARGALELGASALVLDVAGPTPVVIEGPLLDALADGYPWTPSPDDPRVVALIGAALAGIEGLAAVRLSPAAEADVLVTLVVPAAEPGHAGEPQVVRRTPPAPATVAALAQDRLRTAGFPEPLLPGGLDVAVVAG
jgi:SseB protein N-terminal domain